MLDASNQSNSPRALDEAPFLQVCLQSVSDLPDDSARNTAAEMLRALDDGADVADVMRSQTALFAEACDRLGVLRQSDSYRKLTALSLREARRNILISLDRKVLLSTAADLGIATTEVRGPTLGHRFYPGRDLRHTHALKFFIGTPHAQEALGSALQAQSWRNSPFTAQATGYRTAMTSPAGVEAELYQRLLPHSDHVPEPDTLASVEFQVAMILCQSWFEPQKVTKRWVCDLAFIFAAIDVDTAKVASLIKAIGLAGSCRLGLQEYARLVPGSDASKARQTAAKLMSHLDTSAKNTSDANAALRDYRPAPPSLLRRALSKVKRAIISATPPQSAR